jgi:uncharacterized protein with NAD-binding domain and iron-sulfur cluster
MKVAILGGGIGSLSAAWVLAHDTSDQFEITVYQEDHLLGGKGAAVRNLLPGGQERIEEHGIHILFGFYTELMQMLRDAYAEAPKTGPWGQLPDFASAFIPNDWAFLAEEYPGPGDWRQPWAIRFPKMPGDPWDGQGVTDVPTLFERLLQRFIEFVQMLGAAIPGSGSPLFQLIAQLLSNFVANAVFNFALLSAAIVDTLIGFIEKSLQLGWKLAEPFLGLDSVRRLWMGMYLAGANLRGLLTSNILVSGDYASINHLDYREWLADVDSFAPGEVPPSLSWNSPPVLALYDVVFSRSTTFAAGVMLRDALELVLGYRGHLSYRMNGSMGEVVFSPLYLALRAKGVQFRFFHKVTNIQVGDDAGEAVVDRVHFERSLESEYDPLVIAKGSGVPTWPKGPGVTRQGPTGYYISRGAEFDVVVLGIGIGAFSASDSANLAFELCGKSPQFKQMVETVGTAATQAAQLWIDKSVAALGWPHGPAGGPMLISYARPCNSWADMTHLLGSESWPQSNNDGPRSLAYLADELLAGEGTNDADVRENVRSWLKNEATRIWPNFTFDDLHDPNGGSGDARLDPHYFRANVTGSERYTLSEKNTISQRLEPQQSGFRNLALAGDWVKNRLNAGAVESATLAGKAAGKAIIDGAVSA